MKSLLSDDWTFTLTGELDISKTYNWEEFLEFAGYFGTLIKGNVGGEYKGIIVEGKTAMLFAEGRMEELEVNMKMIMLSNILLMMRVKLFLKKNI